MCAGIVKNSERISPDWEMGSKMATAIQCKELNIGAKCPNLMFTLVGFDC